MIEILKAFFTTGSSSLVNMLLNTVAVKVMAIIVGPAGIGLFTSLRQILQTAITASTMGGATALVQGTASRDGEARQDYIRTVLIIFLLGGSITVLTMLLAAPWLSSWLIGRSDSEAVALIRWLTVPVFISILISFASGVLNAYRAIGRLSLVQVCTGFGMAVLAYPAASAVKSGFNIALIMQMVGGELLAVGLGLTFLYRAGWLTPILVGMQRGIDRLAAGHFLKVAGTTIFTGLMGTGALMALRAVIISKGGLSNVGQFDAAWTLSMTYVMLILTSFQTYYLPTLSQTFDPQKRVLLMQRIFRLSILIMVPVITGVIVFKPLVLELLYSKDFNTSLTVMRWMLLGDYIKVSAWTFGMTILAYADMKTFFWTETLWNLSFLVIAVAGVSVLGSLQWTGIAFLICYIIIIFFYSIYDRVRYHFVLSTRMLITWLLGFAILVVASWQTWNDTQVQWVRALLLLAVAGGFSLLSLQKNERKQILKFGLSKLGRKI